MMPRRVLAKLRQPAARRFLLDGSFVLLAGLLVMVFARIYAGFVQDDAYITYRYARNLAAGLGFVYNPGEAVLGTSSPLFAMVLAEAARGTGLEVPAVGLALWSVSLWVSAICFLSLDMPMGRTGSALAGLLLLSHPLLRHSVGMESTFLLALMLLTVLACRKDRGMAASVLVGALIVTRLEMVLFAVVLGVAARHRLRRHPGWILPAAAIVLAWSVYATVAFGSPIPLSATAKLAAARVPFLLGLLFYGHTFLRETGLFAAHVVALAAGVLALLMRREARGSGAILLAWTVVYLAAAAPFAGSFPWYYAPLLPGAVIATLWGVRQIASLPAAADRDGARQEASHRLGRPLFAGLGALLVSINLLFWSKDWQTYRGQNWDHRYRAYVQIADWASDRMTSTQTFATGEIGYLGYFTDARILDLHGLVSPSVHPWLADGLEVTTAKAAQAFAPDYVLIDAGRSAPEAYGLPAGYTLVASFEGRYQIYAR